MSAKKLTNTLFSYEIIGFDVYITYDHTSGILRTISKEDGAILDTRQLEHGMYFDEFCKMTKEMHLDLIDNNGEGTAISSRDIGLKYTQN